MSFALDSPRGLEEGLFEQMRMAQKASSNAGGIGGKIKPAWSLSIIIY